MSFQQAPVDRHHHLSYHCGAHQSVRDSILGKEHRINNEIESFVKIKAQTKLAISLLVLFSFTEDALVRFVAPGNVVEGRPTPTPCTESIATVLAPPMFLLVCNVLVTFVAVLVLCCLVLCYFLLNLIWIWPFVFFSAFGAIFLLFVHLVHLPLCKLLQHLQASFELRASQDVLFLHLFGRESVFAFLTLEFMSICLIVLVFAALDRRLERMGRVTARTLVNFIIYGFVYIFFVWIFVSDALLAVFERFLAIRETTSKIYCLVWLEVVPIFVHVSGWSLLN